MPIISVSILAGNSELVERHSSQFLVEIIGLENQLLGELYQIQAPISGYLLVN
jgi:hypothetical protein